MAVVLGQPLLLFKRVLGVLLTVCCAQPTGHDLRLGVVLFDVRVQLAGQPHTSVNAAAEATVLTGTLQGTTAKAIPCWWEVTGKTTRHCCGCMQEVCRGCGGPSQEATHQSYNCAAGANVAVMMKT